MCDKNPHLQETVEGVLVEGGGSGGVSGYGGVVVVSVGIKAGGVSASTIVSASMGGASICVVHGGRRGGCGGRGIVLVSYCGIPSNIVTIG